MTLWLFVLAAAVLASEAFLRLPLMDQIRRVTATAGKSGRVLKSKRISDHWKERVLPAYSWIIGKGSVTFFVMLCVALLPVALLGVVYPGGFAVWGAELLRPLVILVLCIASIGYIWLRLKVFGG
ncbi:MAG: hypothetical protein KDE08_15700 [Rhodobacteraceae bacterium]|nr:hypothetical protein [Paracoccaceae bacterium]